jgi:hypothetical protein
MKTDNNNRLKVILYNAKLISLSKLQKVQARYGDTHPEIDAVNKQMIKTISSFDNPTLWAYPIPFEENDITTLIVKISLCNPDNLSGFIQDMRNFIFYLEHELLDSPQPTTRSIETDTPSAETSDFNVNVLDAILKNKRYIDGRKQHFKNQGIDVDNHPDFIPLRNEHEPVYTEYRRVLKANLVQSDLIDVETFQLIGNAIQQSTLLPKFFYIYKVFTDTMKELLPKSSASS